MDTKSINSLLSNSMRSSSKVQSKKNNNKDMPILTAGKSILAALADSVILGAGNAAVILKNLPKFSIESFKAIKNSELIGPNLKALLCAVFPLGILASPLLIGVGSSLVGLFKGADDILDGKKGLLESISDTIKTVSKFDNEISKIDNEELEGKLKEFIKEFKEKEKTIDIKLYETFRGIIASLLNGAIGMATFPTVTLAHLPEVLTRLYKDLLKRKEMGPVEKSTIILLSLLALPLIPPLSAVAGAGYGLSKGLKEGYKKGVSTSISELFKGVKEYEDFLKDLKKII